MSLQISDPLERMKIPYIVHEKNHPLLENDLHRQVERDIKNSFDKFLLHLSLNHRGRSINYLIKQYGMRVTREACISHIDFLIQRGILKKGPNEKKPTSLPEGLSKLVKYHYNIPAKALTPNFLYKTSSTKVSPNSIWNKIFRLGQKRTLYELLEDYRGSNISFKKIRLELDQLIENDYVTETPLPDEPLPEIANPKIWHYYPKPPIVFVVK